MGVFAEWQPQYANEGIATFPTIDKKPCVKGWQKIGPKGSAQLTLKFPEANELAFLAGPKSGLTIIDVDTKDEDIWRDSRKRFGETGVMVRTGSGHLQLWYRHNGEARKIRVDEFTDVLGAGQVLGPPSERGMGYQLLRGTIADIANLPFARNIEGGPAGEIQEAVTRELVKAGGRNKALYEHLRTQARFADTYDDLLDVANTFAAESLDVKGGHPFLEREVKEVTKSVWDWTQKKIGTGQYFVGVGHFMTTSHETIDATMSLGIHAYFLHSHLLRRFGGLSTFFLANETRNRMPGGEWPLRKLQEARKALIENGLIKEVRKASTHHGPALYGWPK